MDENTSVNNAVEKGENCSKIELSSAADLFKQLSPAAQDAIIELIKSLLSER